MLIGERPQLAMAKPGVTEKLLEQTLAEASGQMRRAASENHAHCLVANSSSEDVAARRKIIYGASFALLSLAYLYLRHFTWQGGVQLHTLMELAATLLALIVGILALVRFYSRKDNTFLFIGTGFIGTGLLDGYHTAVTCSVFMQYFPSPPPSLIAWSWLASRLFLSVLLWLSWVFWRREARLGESGSVPESLVYLIVSVWTLACFFFFAFVPLPAAYIKVPILHRAQEFIPAFFFLLALVGYLRKGRWKSDPFEHWLVLSIIVGLVGQTMFMSTSAKVYDTMFDAAHLLKKLSYICTLTGLIISMYHLFMGEESIVAERTKELQEEISERKRAEEALRNAERKYRSIFEEAIVGIWQTTPGGRYLSVNPAMARMFGYDSPQELMAAIADIDHQVYVDSTRREDFKRLVDARGFVQNFEHQVYRKDGSKMWLSANAKAVRSNGAVVRYDGTVEDITNRKLLEERVQFLAYYDALTGLPNRTLLQDRLSKALARARRHREKVALLFLDIDRFKNINDSLGHSIGDLLLKELAERLKNWGREQDTVARLGGDEFVVVLTALKDITDAAVAARRIMDAVTGEFLVQSHLLTVTCSFGISVFPNHGTDGEALVKNADAAMYSAKEQGGNNFQFFTKDMNVRAVERLTLENSLRWALERRELFLVYQPQVDIATGNISGAEALLRWRHPELGLVPPNKFIPIAETSGLILPIGEWVLKTACAQARQWQDEGLPALPVAVNVSAVQFRQKSFIHAVKKVLEQTGLPAQYLELELTEGVLLSNADVTLSVLEKLEEMGLKISIDDFGTGYSSLSYLRQFPVYRLKIDRSFVQSMTVDPGAAVIIGTIINMARSLRLKVIAEGVENEEQLLLLRAHHCDEVQGYYFSRPLTAEDFVEKVRSMPCLQSDLQTTMPAHKD